MISKTFESSVKIENGFLKFYFKDDKNMEEHYQMVRKFKDIKSRGTIYHNFTTVASYFGAHYGNNELCIILECPKKYINFTKENLKKIYNSML